MSHIVNAVKVLSSIFIIHILAFCPDNLHWIFGKEELARRPGANIKKAQLSMNLITRIGSFHNKNGDDAPKQRQSELLSFSPLPGGAHPARFPAVWVWPWKEQREFDTRALRRRETLLCALNTQVTSRTKGLPQRSPNSAVNFSRLWSFVVLSFYSIPNLHLVSCSLSSQLNHLCHLPRSLSRPDTAERGMKVLCLWPARLRVVTAVCLRGCER